MNQWLDKRMTLANWACGLNEQLSTCSTSNIRAEECELRELMIHYACHDCFFVTKLSQLLKPFEASRNHLLVDLDDVFDDDSMFLMDEKHSTLNYNLPANESQLIATIVQRTPSNDDMSHMTVHESYERSSTNDIALNEPTVELSTVGHVPSTDNDHTPITITKTTTSNKPKIFTTSNTINKKSNEITLSNVPNDIFLK